MEVHWEEIRQTVGPGLEINEETFTLLSLLELDVV